MMKLCFDHVLARPHWLERYLLGWYILLVCGVFAFATSENRFSFIAQTIWFGLAFPFATWPIVASVRASNRGPNINNLVNTSTVVSAQDRHSQATLDNSKRPEKLATLKNPPRGATQKNL